MDNMKNALAGEAAQSAQGTTTPTNSSINPIENQQDGVFSELAKLQRWVPYALVPRPDNPGKHDKVPHSGSHGLSTKNSTHWRTLAAAETCVAANADTPITLKDGREVHGLHGVGLVFTGGIEKDGMTLVGGDYDVVVDDFQPPFPGYQEESPSGTGRRTFMWVKTDRLRGYKDVEKAHPPGCEHAEFYLGSSPRFMTVTGKVIDDSGIPMLDDAQTDKLLTYLKRAKPERDVLPFEPGGSPVDWSNFKLKPPHFALITGSGSIDRSEILPSLLQTLFDGGVRPADAVTALLTTPALCRYLLNHRNNDADKAIEFARSEVAQAYKGTLAAAYDRLGTFIPAWANWRDTLCPAANTPQPPQANRMPSIIVGPALAHCPELLAPPPRHEFIVDGVVPVCNGELVAPGGTGKTTIQQWEGVHIVLGRDVWARKVLRPGGVLFVTAEDSRDDFLYRLYMLMDAMRLSPTERQRVLQNTFIEDLSGRVARLAELDRSGNIVPTPLVDDLTHAYRGAGLAMVYIDPLAHFGPGERLVNDAEAAMCQVTRHLSDELNAHVRLTHHVGKEVARSGITDQYAGRNGSALADNSRLVMQLVTGACKDWPVPMAARPMLGSGHLPLRMHFHKVSYATKPEYPVWLMRQGWRFHEFDGEPVNECDTRRMDLQKIITYLHTKLAQGFYCSRNTLQTDCTAVGLSKARITVLVNEALQAGELVELPVPEDKKQGRLTHYLAPGGAGVPAAD